MKTLAELSRGASRLISNNSPAILTGIGVAGTVATALLTAKATLKAADLIREHNRALDVNDQWMPPKEKLKLVWMYYIPPVATAACTIGAIVGANRIGVRRTAALAAAYSLTEKAFSEYKDKVAEVFGAKKEEAVRAQVAQDRVNRTPTPEFIIGSGSVLCHDAFTGRFFLCDMETLRRAQNDINADILHNSYASLSDFYALIGLPSTSYSDDVGWNVDHLLELQFSGTLAEDGRPCMCVDFAVAPIRNYYKFG